MHIWEYKIYHIKTHSIANAPQSAKNATMPRPSPPSVSNAKDASQSKKTKKLEKALEEGRAEAKREFEEERARVLDSLSESYRNMIGQIVFAKWKKESLPALILSPFSVPPGPVRTLWMNKFEKVRLPVVVDCLLSLPESHPFFTCVSS